MTATDFWETEDDIIGAYCCLINILDRFVGDFNEDRVQFFCFDFGGIGLSSKEQFSRPVHNA